MDHELGWTLDDLVFRVLEGEAPVGFDCAREDQNHYLHNVAGRDRRERVSVTYLAYIKGICAGFFTWTMDGLRLHRDERPEEIRYPVLPALKLAQLGVDKRFQHFGLGRHIVAFTILRAEDLSHRIGCRYVTLDSQSDLTGWYEGQGFVANKLDQEERRTRAERGRRDPSTLPVSMRFDLRRPSEQTAAF